MDQTCPHCGVRLSAPIDAFCPECRNALDEPPPELQPPTSAPEAATGAGEGAAQPESLPPPVVLLIGVGFLSLLGGLFLLSPAAFGEYANALIMAFGGVYCTLLGHRVVGKKAGVSREHDEWHRRWGGPFKVLGPLLVVGGLFLAVLGVTRP